MKRLLVALLLVYPISAMAQTYEWTDQQGTVHFTEDLGSVPKKYRKKVKKLGGDEGGVSQTTTTSEPAPAKGEAKPEGADNAKKVYGGKDEAAWRNAFKAAKGDVERTESELATLRGRMRDTSSMSRSEYIAIQNTTKHTEVRLQEMQRRLQLLQQSADRAGVPLDVRQ